MSTQSANKSRRTRIFAIVGTAGALAAAGVLLMPQAAGAWGRWHRSSDVTVEDIEEGIEWGASRILHKVDATDEQEAQVEELLKGVAPEILQYRKEGREIRAKFTAALSKKDVDPEELETLRASGVAVADKASKRAVEVVGELADILTPEQRAELMAYVRSRRR